MAGEPVTSDMFTDDAVEIYFSEEDHLWYAAVNPAGDSYWYISIDDATLETVSTAGTYKIYFGGSTTSRVRVFQDADEASNTFNKGTVHTLMMTLAVYAD